jgi:hypothetical protein
MNLMCFGCFEGAYEKFVFGVDPLQQKFRVKPKGEDIHNISTRCEGIPKISLTLGYVEDAPTLGPFSP